MKRLEPVRSLMEITADRIRDAIISGELPLGSKLSEQKLAETLGVSRSPVHNALALLQYEGLVSVQPNVGSFVFTPGIKQALDLCEHRAVLECASLRLALKADPERLIESLVRCNARMEAALRGDDPTAYTQGDMAFHATIVECSGNSSMARAYPHTIGPLMALRTHLFTAMNAHLDRSFAEHEAIIDACRRRSVDEASSVLEAHIGHLVAEYQAAQEQEAGPQRTGPARGKG
jgi:DNA-binding GntR family transcriptional regulator